VNHSVPIGPGLPVIAKGVSALGMKQLPKAVLAGQFLQTLLASTQSLPVAGAVPKNPSKVEARTATPGETAQLPTNLEPTMNGEPTTDARTAPGAASAIHPNVGTTALVEHIPIVMPNQSVRAAKVSATPLALPSSGPATTKKSGAKEGERATLELAPVREAAAPTLAIVPRELPAKPPSDAERQTEGVTPELCVAVAVVGGNGAKNLGTIAVGKVKPGMSEGRKTDTIDPAVGHPLPAEAVAANVAPAPLIGPHDAAHSSRDVPAIGSGMAAVGNVVSFAPHASSVAKRVGVVAPHVEATSQASDLKTLVATPNVLEVGIASGAHGWLKVRAEFAETGEVAASVVAGSASAAQSLHKELPGISAYLAGERVGVSSLVVNSAERGAGAQSSTLGSGTGGAATTDDGRSHGGRDIPAATAKGSSRAADLLADASALLGASGMNAPLMLHANGSGSWLSVRV